MAKTRRVSKARQATVDRSSERKKTAASELRELRAEATLADIAGGDDWGGGFGDFGGFDSGWGFDSFDSGWDPFASDPLSFGTGPFGTDPFGTDPFGTDPFGTDPFGTDPLGTDPFGTDPAMGPFADPATGTADPAAMGPFVTDPTAGTPGPGAMGPFISDPGATGTIDPAAGDPTPQGTWYDSGDGGSYFVPAAETTPLQQYGGEPPLDPTPGAHAGEHVGEHAGEMGPFPTDDSPHEELPLAQLDTGTAPPLSGGSELGGGNDDGDFLSPAYDANGGSTYTWGPEDPATTGPVDDNQPPPGQLSFDPAATLAAAQDLSSNPPGTTPWNSNDPTASTGLPSNEGRAIGVMEGVASSGGESPSGFGSGDDGDLSGADLFESPEGGNWGFDGGNFTGGFWTSDPSGLSGPNTAGQDGGALPDFGTPAAPVYDVDNGGGTYAEPVGGASNLVDGAAPAATADTVGVEPATNQGVEGDPAQQQGYWVETEGGSYFVAAPATATPLAPEPSPTQPASTEPPVVGATPDVPLPAPIDAGPTPVTDATGTPTPPAPTAGGPAGTTDASLLQNPDLGSCFVDASLNGAGSWVNQLVTDNGNGTFTVTLTSRTGNTYEVMVVPTTTPHGATPLGTDALTARNMAIVEQAIGLARDNGSTRAPGEITDYDSISKGGTVAGVLNQIGLADVHSTWRMDANVSGYTVVSAFENGNIVVISTTKDASHPSLEAWGLSQNHAYTVKNVTEDQATGLTLVTVADPNGGTVVVPAQILGNGVLADVSWGRPPGSPESPNNFGPGEQPGNNPPQPFPTTPNDNYGPGDRPADTDTYGSGGNGGD